MRPIGALQVAFIALLSGCLANGPGGDPAGSDDTDASDGSDSTPSPSSPKPSKTTPSPTPSPPGGSGGGNSTPNQTEQPPWPNVSSATIRPGVRITSSAGQCTSNFVFRSPDNSTLYLGVAAHCVDGEEIGDTVTIQGASKPGTLAYSSWLALNLTNCDTGGQCGNDFAIVEVDPADRGKVHPAMLHFGGPTAVFDSSQIATGNKVLTYGNSGLRAGIDPSNWHEGIVSGSQGSGVQFTVYTVTPGIPGDSGSGVMLKDGRAAGVLVTIYYVPPGQNGVVGLKKAMDLAYDTTGLKVELCTWGVLDDGLLP